MSSHSKSLIAELFEADPPVSVGKSRFNLEISWEEFLTLAINLPCKKPAAYAWAIKYADKLNLKLPTEKTFGIWWSRRRTALKPMFPANDPDGKLATRPSAKRTRAHPTSKDSPPTIPNVYDPAKPHLPPAEQETLVQTRSSAAASILADQSNPFDELLSIKEEIKNLEVNESYPAQALALYERHDLHHDRIVWGGGAPPPTESLRRIDEIRTKMEVAGLLWKRPRDGTGDL